MPQAIPYQLIKSPETQKPGVPSRGTAGTAARVDPVVFGRGLLTPFERDGKGDFANADDISLVRANVRQVLDTLSSSGSTAGELPWRPEFGSILKLLRYRNLDATTVELARTYVIDALRVWVPRVRVRDASVSPDYARNLLTIRIVYDLLGRNGRTVLERNITTLVAVPVAG